MESHIKHAKFSGNLVMVGFGSIGRGVLPLLLRHLEMDPWQIHIFAPEGDPEPLFETVATGDVDSPVPDGAITLSPPNITKGLPLSAYSDDQLDDVAPWLRATSADADEGELVEGMREAIGLRRRGSQSHAILLNVIRRTSGQ